MGKIRTCKCVSVLNCELLSVKYIYTVYMYALMHICVCVCERVSAYANEGRCSFPPTRKSNLQCLRQVKCSDVLSESWGHFSHLRCKLET